MILLLITFNLYANEYIAELKTQKDGSEYMYEHTCYATVVGNHQIITAHHCLGKEPLKNLIMFYEQMPYELHRVVYENKDVDVALIEIKGNLALSMAPNMIFTDSSKDLYLGQIKCTFNEQNLYKCQAKEGDSGSPLWEEDENNNFYLKGILIEGDKKKELIKIAPLPKKILEFLHTF